MVDHSHVSLSEFPLDARPDDFVSPGFRFRDLTHSDIANRFTIDNSLPGRAELEAAIHLCREVLEPIRTTFQVPFSPNSFFRSQPLERQLKQKPASWISTSQHTLGQACDISLPGVPTLDLASWVGEHLEFDQLICECCDPSQGPSSGWVHVSLKPEGMSNRREVLSYVLDAEKETYVYIEGLRGSIA